MLDVKEQQAVLTKAQIAKEDKRVRHLEERTFQLARARIDEEIKHVERVMERDRERFVPSPNHAVTPFGRLVNETAPMQAPG